MFIFLLHESFALNDFEFIMLAKKSYYRGRRPGKCSGVAQSKLSLNEEFFWREKVISSEFWRNGSRQRFTPRSHTNSLQSWQSFTSLQSWFLNLKLLECMKWLFSIPADLIKPSTCWVNWPSQLWWQSTQSSTSSSTQSTTDIPRSILEASPAIGMPIRSVKILLVLIIKISQNQTSFSVLNGSKNSTRSRRGAVIKRPRRYEKVERNLEVKIFFFSVLIWRHKREREAYEKASTLGSLSLWIQIIYQARGRRRRGEAIGLARLLKWMGRLAEAGLVC